MEKKTVIILLMLITLLGTAQDKRFTFSLRTELADKNTHNEVYDYGFNLGGQIEYQMTWLYFNAEVYAFPELNGIDYLHFQGTVLGINHHSWDEQWRIYAGLLRPGFILRDGGPHALFGQDIGVEWYFNNDNYVGIKTGLDTKGDSKIWGKENHNVWYFSINFGWYW